MLFNDRNTALSLCLTRRSGKARDMSAPGPSDAQLAMILEAASRVPDHGKLAPWRFLIVPPEQRTALADLLERAYLDEKPAAGAAELKTMRDFAAQAPTLVVVASAPVVTSHIPVWEQQLSAGAACQSLLMAAHALGFVGNWLTGWPAYSAAVTQALFPEPDARIAGYLFLGSPTRELEERPRPTPEKVISVWPGLPG
jgi:nitroreductase